MLADQRFSRCPQCDFAFVSKSNTPASWAETDGRDPVSGAHDPLEITNWYEIDSALSVLAPRSQR
jgi:hypothetical protein